MSRPPLVSLIAALVISGFAAKAPAKPHALKHSAHPARMERHALPAPKPAAQVNADLAAALHASRMAGEAIQYAIQGDAVTITGSVNEAEYKGEATELAWRVLKRDGWKQYHVWNHLTVAAQ